MPFNTKHVILGLPQHQGPWGPALILIKAAVMRFPGLLRTWPYRKRFSTNLFSIRAIFRLPRIAYLGLYATKSPRLLTAASSFWAYVADSMNFLSWIILWKHDNFDGYWDAQFLKKNNSSIVFGFIKKVSINEFKVYLDDEWCRFWPRKIICPAVPA